jgi:hypothetical protein
MPTELIGQITTMLEGVPQTWLVMIALFMVVTHLVVKQKRVNRGTVTYVIIVGAVFMFLLFSFEVFKFIWSAVWKC